MGITWEPRALSIAWLCQRPSLCRSFESWKAAAAREARSELSGRSCARMG